MDKLIESATYNLWGQKLRDLLKEHGDFKMVETEIARWHTEVNRNGRNGKWCTKAYLKDQEKYTSFLV